MALPCVFTLSGLMMSTSRNGITITARNSDTMRLMPMVQGKSFIASRNAPLKVMSSGKKITLMHKVASIMGMKYCFAESMAAFFGS